MKFSLFSREDDDNNNEHDDEDHEKKDFEDEDFEFSSIEVNNDEVKVESDSENCEIEYEIQCKDTDPIVSKMEYKSTNITTGVESETKSRVLIHGIQEWVDINNDGLMQDDEKIGNMYFVGSNEYEEITYSGPDIYDTYTFTVNEKPDGYLSMIFYLTSNFTQYYNPNSMKFDIIISDWQYKNSNNQLALLMEYRTENEMETDEEGYVSQKTIDPSAGYSALRWSSFFDGNNGVTGTIQTRILNNDDLSLLVNTNNEYEHEQSSGIWFCFSAKGASSIYWDPDIGVYTTPLNSVSNSGSSNSNKLFLTRGIGAIIVFSFIGIGLISGLIVIFLNKLKLRKNNKTEYPADIDLI